jgi:RNA polymerase sigma-54 factor
MKQGLSLRVSQHLALTPQLQQSIRLLQLSTLELSQEVEQMLDDNPFLELNAEEAPREEFGLPQVDTPVRRDDLEAESASSSIASNDQATLGSDQNESEVAVPESWEGDGTTEVLPDDSEWGGDAPARKNNLGDDDERADASELARSQESLTTFLHRQALALRLSEVDRAALRFLIESLNDDGYLEDSLASLAAGLAGDDLEQAEELEHRFSMALGLLQSLEPTGVGARHLGECLSLQLKARLADSPGDAIAATALRICAQPMELLARRDIKRLMQLCSDTEADVRAAIGLIGRLEPKPGRRFVDVERNIIIPDVIVTRLSGGGQPRFCGAAQRRRDAAPARARHLRQRPAPAQGRGQPGAAAAAAGSALVHQEHPAAL